MIVVSTRDPHTPRTTTSRGLRPLAALSVAVIALSAPPVLAQSAVSDAEQLASGLPPGFVRTKVYLLPLLDLRALGHAQPANEPPPPIWTALQDSLRARSNLDLHSPARVLRDLTSDVSRGRSLALARELAARAKLDYQRVRLREAADALERAAAALIDLEQHLVDAREVASVLLIRALALHELDAPEAPDGFRDALLIDSTLRLQPGIDRPDAVAALDDARRRLLTDLPALGQPIRSAASRASAFVLQARALPDRMEIAIHSPGAIRFEVQPYSDDPMDDADRLASRIWSCLPFGRPATTGNRGLGLRLDAGFTAFGFVERPVSPVGNLGIEAALSWQYARHLTLDLILRGAVSGRDEREDLRSALPTGRAHLGPGVTVGDGRWRGFATLGVELLASGAYETTTNAACKYFSRGDAVPTVVCDFDRDIDRRDPSLQVGPSLTVGGSLRLVGEVYLVLRAHAATYLVETRNSGLGTPLGGSVGLGYRL